MAFKKVPGLNGQVFVPEDKPDSRRKHDCPDCYACQICSDDRCAVCRNDDRCRRKTLSDKS